MNRIVLKWLGRIQKLRPFHPVMHSKMMSYFVSWWMGGGGTFVPLGIVRRVIERNVGVIVVVVAVVADDGGVH